MKIEFKDATKMRIHDGWRRVENSVNFVPVYEYPTDWDFDDKELGAVVSFDGDKIVSIERRIFRG